MSLLTPFQTVGPYLSLGLRTASAHLPATYPGARISIRGHLLDGRGSGVPDGVLEWWHPSLPAIQRSMTGDGGAFHVETIKPAADTGQEAHVNAPHFAVRVLGRGILTQYVTRLYFADEPDTANDAILNVVPAERRHTLIARPVSATEYRFDVILQG